MRIIEWEWITEEKKKDDIKNIYILSNLMQWVFCEDFLHTCTQ